jgi:hypothetical protein
MGVFRMIGGEIANKDRVRVGRASVKVQQGSAAGCSWRGDTNAKVSAAVSRDHRHRDR